MIFFCAVSDVGCSERIISGQVKVKSAVHVAHVGERDIFLSDGTTLDGDVLVLA